MQTRGSEGARLSFLDHLKIWLTVLVIFHHAGQAYGNGGGWPYSPSNPEEFMPWIWHFFSVNAAFFMGLFFLISGYFVPKSYDRQGAGTFIARKLLRLGVPLLVLGGLLSWMSGKFEIAHLWYVESLLVFCLLYALLRCFIPALKAGGAGRVRLTGIIAAGLVMGIGTQLIRQVSPQDHWIWPLDVIPMPLEPAHYLQYVMMFCAGILARRFSWLRGLDRRTGLTCLILGILMALGLFLRDGGRWDRLVGVWFGIYESLFCVLICTGLVWLFREHLAGCSGFLAWCARQAFGVYLVHLPLMLVLQFATDSLWMGALGKFLFIGTVTTLLSFALTGLLRCVPLVRKVI